MSFNSKSNNIGFMSTEKKPSVLFLCSHNSARSQMAEYFLRKYAGEHFEVYSAGLEVSTINPLTIKVMEEKGFDLSTQSPKPLKQWLGKKHFGIMISVCSSAEENCPTAPGLGKRLYWPFEDPSSFEGTNEEKLQKFREVRDLIEQKILSWIKERGLIE